MDYGALAEMFRHPGWSAFRDSPFRAEGRLVLFSTRGASPLHDFRFQPGDTLLLGRESAGVPDEVHDAAQARVFIPLAAGARSLNVTVAAAIGLAEALRQISGFPNAGGQ